MKRSKWCKYCDEDRFICLSESDDPCQSARHDTDFKLQQYRDSLAKLVRETRYIEDNGFIECARMLDPEKSARVAARVQEIKEWMKQHV